MKENRMSDVNQKSIFLGSEGDAWFERNRTLESKELDYIDKSIYSQISGCASILEIGCADGKRLKNIGMRDLEPRKLVGIDPSQRAVAAGKMIAPELDLRVGTADSLPKDEVFDSVILGFCLYLCDRNLLSKIVSEVDRVLNEDGILIIVDFDPAYPRQRKYRHYVGVWSYKMDYSTLFTAYPHFVLANKTPMSHQGDSWTIDESERVAIWTIRKSAGGYSEEADI
jgi:SAM-dependent methyltransferase